MAESLISKRLLEVIPTHLLEMEKVQGSRHFQISNAIFSDMKAGRAVGCHGCLIGQGRTSNEA
jgi:hypothetical protein